LQTEHVLGLHIRPQCTATFLIHVLNVHHTHPHTHTHTHTHTHARTYTQGITAFSLPGANRPIGPWPIRFLALSLPGTFAPGAKWPGNFRSRELDLSRYLHTGIDAVIVCRCPQLLASREIHQQNCKETPHRCR